MANQQYVPKGYHNVIPSLSFKGTEDAITWYKNVFEARERGRVAGPDRKIMHAELTIGDSMIFLAEQNPQYGNQTPQSVNGNSISLHLYVQDVDATIRKAAQNGGKVIMEPMDMFYGDRCGNIEDPFGYSWAIATHVKDVSEEEMQKMAEEFKPEHA